jgi:hypothetical protein
VFFFASDFGSFLSGWHRRYYLMEFLTPELVDTLIIANIIVALAIAGVRFYRDLRRPTAISWRSSQDTATPDAIHESDV